MKYRDVTGRRERRLEGRSRNLTAPPSDIREAHLLNIWSEGAQHLQHPAQEIVHLTPEPIREARTDLGEMDEADEGMDVKCCPDFLSSAHTEQPPIVASNIHTWIII